MSNVISCLRKMDLGATMADSPLAHPAKAAHLWPCCHRISIVLRNGAYLLPAALLYGTPSL